MMFTEKGSMASSAMSLSLQVLRGRWFMVFASFIIMSVAGATYIFSIYSKDIKSSLGYDQQTLNTLSFFKDLGANVGVLSGLINEVTPPWVVLAMGSCMNLAGYLMIYLAITHRISRPAVWQMCLYITIGANSQSFANTGALVTTVKNFPESRGIVLGLLKGFVGLSGAIFTQLYLAFYGPENSKSLVLLIAWLPAAVSLVFVHIIRIMKPDRRKAAADTKPFFLFLYISLALATYLMVLIIVQKQFTFSKPEYGCSSIAVFVLLFLPLAVVVNQELKLRAENSDSIRNLPSPIIVIDKLKSETKDEDKSNATQPATDSCIGRVFKAPDRGEDYSILQALFSIDMMVLFFATICGVGGTLTAIDNMGQIGESLGYPAKTINTFVSLISIWNYAGRVTAGFLSETLITKYKMPRPLMLTFVLVLSCSGHLLIAFGVPGSLYIASVIIGFCFGAQWPLLYAIISEVFGLKYYSTLYNFGGVASPIGSYILNVKVAGHLYDREAEKQNIGKVLAPGKEKICMGVECFKLSFLIITAATVVGAVVSLLLVWRTRNFYKSDIYARFRETEVVESTSEDSDVSARKNGEVVERSSEASDGEVVERSSEASDVCARKNGDEGMGVAENGK